MLGALEGGRYIDDRLIINFVHMQYRSGKRLLDLPSLSCGPGIIPGVQTPGDGGVNHSSARTVISLKL